MGRESGGIMRRILFWGSKAYPTKEGFNEDKRSIGGIEIAFEQILSGLSEEKNFELYIITRKFKNQKMFEKKGKINIIRVPWIKGPL